MLDARDLAAWLVDSAGRGDVGTFDAVGLLTHFADMLSLCAEAVAGFDGKVFAAAPQWLVEHEVGALDGPGVPAAVAAPEMAEHDAAQRRPGCGRGARATAPPGVRRRRAALRAPSGLDRPRLAGLSPQRESELLAELLAG